MTADTEAKPVQVEDVAIPEYLQKLLETIAKREGFAEGYKIVSRPGSNVGDGFVGIMLSVVISGTRNGNADEELVLICKIPPVSEMRRKFAFGPFVQEIEAYDKILPEFVKFQRESGISEEDGFFAFPKCYGTYSDEENFEFAIVLEDLRHIGFRMWNKYAPINYEHVRLAVTELGKFHALSFALRQQRPDKFKEYHSVASSLFKILDEVPHFSNQFEKSYENAIAALQPEDTEELRKLTHLRHNFKAILKYAVSGKEAEPFAVLCHGDCWNNNMMFQYESADSMEPKRVFLIDWQISQYSSPATDLLYYLYTSTEQPLRTSHFDDIVLDYHTSLSALLQRIGGNPDSQFSFDDLHRQLSTFGIYCLIMAPVVIQAVTMKAEDIPDMDAVTEENMHEYDLLAKGKPTGFNKRIRDVVCDFVKRGFFGEKILALKGAEEKTN